MALDVKCPARNVQTWLRWDRLVSASSSLEADRLRMWSSVDFVYRMNPQLPVCCSILIKMMFPLISVDSKLDGCTEIVELWQKLHKICLHLITISWVFWMWLSQNFWSINDKNNSIMILQFASEFHSNKWIPEIVLPKRMELKIILSYYFFCIVRLNHVL